MRATVLMHVCHAPDLRIYLPSLSSHQSTPPPSPHPAPPLTPPQAQRGPDQLEWLSKRDVMGRAEASGLADKPIAGEGLPAHGAAGNARAFYNGWSSLNTVLVNKHALVGTWSNPLKCSLTPKVGEGRAVCGVGWGRMGWGGVCRCMG
jgi:hypothetical protein